LPDVRALSQRGYVPTSDEHSPQVSQASGMVSVQAQCSVDEALVMLKERAQVSGQTLAEVAAATVERRIRFGPDT
jgi:ANTAR domain